MEECFMYYTESLLLSIVYELITQIGKHAVIYIYTKLKKT